MNHTVSLKKNAQFRSVYNRGKSIANRMLVMYILKNNEGHNRLGVTVSKKVGKSVCRSRVGRLIKESYRLCEARVMAGFDIVVIARVSAKEAGYFEIEGALRHLLKKQGIWRSAQDENA